MTLYRKSYIMISIMENKTNDQPTTEIQQPTKLLTINLPQELHTKLKAQCALQGQTMSEVVIKLLDMYLNFSQTQVNKD